VDADPSFERLAPVPFSTVVFRYRPACLTDEAPLERINAELLRSINESGEVYMSHTKAKGRYALRLAIGNARTEERHVAAAWQIVRTATASATSN
jgi:aromatic-L-amino-acid decarboxylase